MKPSELLEIIKQQESETLEYKTRLPDPQRAADVLASFANTNGGMVIVGVKEGNNGPEVIGVVDPQREIRILDQATRLISPTLIISSEVVDINGKSVIAATIGQGIHKPYLTSGSAFQRSGDRIVPITADALVNSIRESNPDLNSVMAEVRQLSVVIEKLNNELIAAKSWRSKIVDMIIGGIIGALISIIIAFLIGLM